MLLELLAIYVVKDTLEGISKRLEEDQKRKERLQRQQRRKTGRAK